MAIKFYYNKRSPFVRKVWLAALEKGLEKQIDFIEVDLKNRPSSLYEANALGKIPAMVLEDGTALADSPVLAAYIDSLNKTPVLIPRSGIKKFKVLNVEGLADGVAEAAITAYMESLKPDDKRDDAVIHKNVDNIFRTLAYLEKNDLRLLKSKRLTLAPLAVASAIGYINLRPPHLGWEKKNKKLARWYVAFSERDSMKRTMPVAV